MIKLLVVDDEKGLCEYLKEFFSLRGHEVYTAASGQEALSIVKRESPDLGIVEFLSKPVDFKTLEKVIKKALGKDYPQAAHFKVTKSKITALLV